jgi:cyclopropane-fatty-acyl-phospholipid synthase
MIERTNLSPSSPAAERLLSPRAAHGETRAPGLAERACRAALHRVLAGLRGARLTVRDAESTARFGSTAGIDDPAATVTVLDPSFYTACALRGVIGAGEAFMEGAWRTDDLVAVVRALARNREVLGGLDRGAMRLARPLFQAFALLHRNTRSGSRRNIAAHYDLGNDMFELFLDPTMTYSSAVFPHESADLEEAQREKYERLCTKLGLASVHRVLEVGTGWGGFAMHAASTRGCRVTTTTISVEQYRLAVERIAAAGLADRVEVLLCDYRDLVGTFDRIVSIEMIEAVGHEYMRDYFRVLSERLTPDGVCALQAIVNPDQVFEESKKSPDFIRRYIFPGGHLPSVWSMADAVKHATDLRLVHLEEMSPHYARTLAAWSDRFRANLGRLAELGYDQRFARMWEFYLAYCEGAFRERAVGVVQVVFEKPMARRDSLLGELAPVRQGA